MKETRVYLMIVMAGLGFAAGFATHRMTVSAAMPADVEPEGKTREEAPKAQVAVVPDFPRSTDTAAGLLELDRASLAGRLGLWLMDASEAEIAEFWAEYGKRKPPDRWSATLVFHYWTKLNPSAAMEVARRDGVEEAAMAGWIMHDPASALASTEGRDRRVRDHARYVLTLYHPERGMKMARNDPENAHMLDLETIADVIAKDDPEEAMDFLLEMGQSHFTTALERWTREDPEAATAWILEHRDKTELLVAFLGTLELEHPERMKELASELPDGVTKRTIEKRIFDKLVKSDPTAALEEARKAPVPRLAAEQFSAVGRAMIRENPQAALGVMKELFAACPDAAARATGSITPQGMDSVERGVTGVDAFLGDLVAWDAAATMAAAVSLPGERDGLFMNDRDAMNTVARLWVERDPVALAEWCGAQEDAAIRDAGIKEAVGKLSEQGRYDESLHWALQGEDWQARDVFLAWVKADRDAAAGWLNEAEVPEKLREEMVKKLEGAGQ